MSVGRAASFYDHLKQALELCNDPAQLGDRSPLATPYLLGAALYQSSPGESFAAVLENLPRVQMMHRWLNLRHRHRRAMS
jgi:hypothetical protein